MNQVQNFTKGFVKENPVFVLLLGLCPTLGVTTSAVNGLGMGLGFSFALTLLGAVRELLGSGALFGFKFIQGDGMLVFVLAPGAFILLGLIVWFQRAITGHYEEE